MEMLKRGVYETPSNEETRRAATSLVDSFESILNDRKHQTNEMTLQYRAADAPNEMTRMEVGRPDTMRARKQDEK